MNYPQHASDAEKAGWALCTGIDMALFVFGGMALLLMSLAMVSEYLRNRKR